MINTRAAGDSRFARTGKDGAIYNADGVLLATVDSFTANVTYNNAAYSVLGNAQELETANTFKVALTMSQVVVEDDAFIQELVEAMESQTRGKSGTKYFKSIFRTEVVRWRNQNFIDRSASMGAQPMKYTSE